jgi:hypothetical protein
LSLVGNERTKLLANAMNTAATSSFTVGVLAPMAAAFYNVGSTSVTLKTLILGTSVWFFAAIALPYGCEARSERAPR